MTTNTGSWLNPAFCEWTTNTTQHTIILYKHQATPERDDVYDDTTMFLATFPMVWYHRDARASKPISLTFTIIRTLQINTRYTQYKEHLFFFPAITTSTRAMWRIIIMHSSSYWRCNKRGAKGVRFIRMK
jgi:hypothetical protein